MGPSVDASGPARGGRTPEPASGAAGDTSSRSPDAGERPPRWAVLGTARFVPLVPGTIAVLVPWMLSGWRIGPPLLGIGALRWAGAALIVAALPLFTSFVLRVVREGHGTPAPVAPRWVDRDDVGDAPEFLDVRPLGCRRESCFARTASLTAGSRATTSPAPWSTAT